MLLSENVPGNDWAIDLWIPLDGRGIGSLPSALAGSTIAIRAEREQTVIREWDGQPLDIKL